MSLKNSFHTQLAVGILLQDEETLDDKLNLLTELSIRSPKEEMLKICEEFRERLCREEVEKIRANGLRVKYQRQPRLSSWDEITTANNGEL